MFIMYPFGHGATGIYNLASVLKEGALCCGLGRDANMPERFDCRFRHQGYRVLGMWPRANGRAGARGNRARTVAYRSSGHSQPDYSDQNARR